MEEYHEAYMNGLNDGIRIENERVRKEIKAKKKEMNEARTELSYEKGDYADSKYRALKEILEVIGEIK